MPPTRTLRYLTPALAILLLATALRFPLLTANRFHPDEALYAYFARLIASGRDLWLQAEVVDKPPLSLYLMAASFRTFGASEFAARLPAMAASLVSVALVMRLVADLYCVPPTYSVLRIPYSPAHYAIRNTKYAIRTTAILPSLAGLLFTLSPLAILFAPTIFPDSLLMPLALGSLLAAVRGRWGWMGVTLGLAFATKQTALLFLPPGLGLALLANPDLRRLPARLGRTAAGFIPLAAVVFGWDLVRQAPISFWAQGFSDNNPGRLIRSAEVLPRLLAWANLLRYFAPSLLFAALVALGLIVLLRRALRTPTTFPASVDLLLLTYCMAYLGAYWLLAFNVWDRYLLMLTPLLAILAARALEGIAYRVAYFVFRILTTLHTIHNTQYAIRNTYYALAFLPALLLVAPALRAAQSGYPIGGDTGAYDGIDQLAARIRTLPEGAVLYDHWLGWELSFYLFDGPVYLSWFPTPAALTEDLLAFGQTSPRYLAVPAWESETELRAAAEAAGFSLTPIYQTFRRDGTPSFTLYESANLRIPLVP